MASILFYGAGQNARENFDIWVKEGLNPVCFCDSDITKHYTKFLGLEILPLIVAISRYPDYELYCTQASANLYDVRKFLLSIGIPEERIKFCAKTDGSHSPQLPNTLYPQLYQIYQALQDELSRKTFWGRMEYSLSHSLTGIYRSMVSKEHLRWISTKQTFAMQRYGLHALWELLAENYPVQKHKIYLLIFDEEWNEYNWVVERFLKAMPGMGIQIHGYVLPYSLSERREFKGLTCISEKEFIERIDENTRIIIGFPGWCFQTKDVIERYEPYKNILYPIADTGHPQYIEPDIFAPAPNEIYVDVGVFDLQNSIDFSKWATKGYEKIYAFEPDPGCYQRSMKRLKEMDEEFYAKTELIQKGLSNTNGTLEFPANYKGSGNYGETKEMISVEVVSLDSYLDGKPVTLVKMDVEGAEMSVLLGMKSTIMCHKPRMAICVYHKHQDLLEIASYLLKLVPEYKFYLRHYNSNETETVLFCTV